MTQVINLSALRCPDATVKMRRVIHAFIDSSVTSIAIESLEPSFVNSIPAILATFEQPIELTSITERAIEPKEREDWDESDIEDNADMVNWKIFTLTKK